jgi:phosphatidylglycerophosphatase GEP4
VTVTGDRLFTNVIRHYPLPHSPRTPWTYFVTRRAQVSHRFGSAPSQDPGVRGPAPLAVWTTGVWQRESMAMRWAESRLVHFVEGWIEGARQRRDSLEDRFVRNPLEHVKETEKEKPVLGWFSWARNGLTR